MVTVVEVTEASVSTHGSLGTKNNIILVVLVLVQL